ncbi:MAG: hypothetical protein ACRENL_05770 [Candidatus Dormibacteria bacterium]
MVLSGGLPPAPVEHGGARLCSEPGCPALDAVPCAYVDRRQRRCPTAWCSVHARIAFGAIHCRRHAGIVEALGQDQLGEPMPDLDNRAPSLANWVGRDLDAPIRTLLETHFPGRTMNAGPVVSSGSWRERSWGRSWKLISPQGVDASVSVSVAEADDGVVKVSYDGKVLAELIPPWIEDRRRGAAPDPETDRQERQQYYAGIVERLEAAMIATERRPNTW